MPTPLSPLLPALELAGLSIIPKEISLCFILPFQMTITMFIILLKMEVTCLLFLNNTKAYV